ncbi:unnamed protein product [Agarophyton chilense]
MPDVVVAALQTPHIRIRIAAALQVFNIACSVSYACCGRIPKMLPISRRSENPCKEGKEHLTVSSLERWLSSMSLHEIGAMRVGTIVLQNHRKQNKDGL